MSNQDYLVLDFLSILTEKSRAGIRSDSGRSKAKILIFGKLNSPRCQIISFVSFSHFMLPTLRTCFDTFWYFYNKPVSRKDSHRIGKIWSCELRFYFPLVFFSVHLKLLTQCRDHTSLGNKYRKSEIRSAECRMLYFGKVISQLE